MREVEDERQREWILRAPQLVRDREYPFSKDLTLYSSGSVGVSLPVLSKVSGLVEALPLGGSCKLFHQLWSQFTPIAGQVNVDVMWSQDELLVSALLLPYYTNPSRLYNVVLLLVNHLQWPVPTHFVQSLHLHKDSWLLRYRVREAERAHLGLQSLLGQHPISSGLHVNSGSIQQQNE